MESAGFFSTNRDENGWFRILFHEMTQNNTVGIPLFLVFLHYLIGTMIKIMQQNNAQMKNLILLCIGCILLAMASCIPSSQKKGPVHVFITAGQSNTDGRVNNKQLPAYIQPFATDTVEYKEGAYPFCRISQNRVDGVFVPYWPKGRITEGLWTYDAVTYRQIGEALQEEFYVVKWAVGGTSIGFPSDTTQGRYWSADPAWLSNTTSTQSGGKSLLLSFTEAIDASIDQTLSKLEQGYQIDAFLWHQGESDCKYAGDYYKNLKGVIAYVRTHLTEKTGKDYSKLPFVFGSIPHTNRDYRLEVEVAMQRIAEEDMHVYLIDMRDGELQKDRLHFTATSAEYLGQKMFDVLNKILDFSNMGFRVATYKDNKAAAISYTFDDGLMEQYTLAAPELEKHGFRGTFFVNGNTHEEGIIDSTRMTWPMMKELHDKGHEIGNHGWAHKNFGRHSLEEIKTDIYKNDSVIVAHIGLMPRTFCYPHNTKTAEGFVVASANRVGTRLFQRSIGGKATTENLAEWVDDLIRSNDWGVGMTHGITYGYDHFGDAALFWDHLDRVKAKEDSLWVGTFAEVAAYTREQKEITFEVIKQKNGLTIIPHLSLDKAVFTEPLTGVVKGYKRVSVRQGGKELDTRKQDDAFLFDFDPFGEPIEIIK